MATKTKTIVLNVLLQEGDFSIECADELSVRAGESIVFSIDVTPLLGFNSPVQFTIGGGPTGMTVNWQTGDTWQPGQPEPDNLSCVLAVPLDNALVGTHMVEVTGTSL
jgi:hypothetical protein